MPDEKDDDAGRADLGDGAAGGTLTEDRVVAIVRDVVGDLLADGGKGGKADEKGEGGQDGVEGSKPRTQAAVEDDFEARTRRVIDKIKADEDHARQHAELGKKDDKPASEDAPVKYRRSDRFWGAGADAK